MTVEKKLLDNGKVEVIETTERDRYVGYCEYDESEPEFVVEDFKANNKAWICKNREGFEKLATDESWEPERKSVESDIELFQKYLDETYGKDKYEAYALGAYVHGMVSFAFNKSDDTRCRWDSGTCGFVGISKELKVDLSRYASNLSDAWNGSIERLYVYDNYNDEPVDEITSLSTQKEINEWKEQMKEKYGVEEYKDNNRY